MSTTYNVSSGVTSTGLYLANGDAMNVFFDGKADNTTLDTHGHLIVYSGGVADRTTHTGWESYFTVNSGGLASRTTLTVGYMDIYDGGVADDVDIISGVLYVASGGTATGVKWTPCTGAYYVDSGGTVTLAGSYSGVYYGSDFQLLSSAATMDGKKLTSGCTMCVMDGGTAKDTEVSDYGAVYVYSGGVASNTGLSIYGGMNVFSGGSAHEVSVTYGGLYVYYGGKADAVTVHEHGWLEFSGGGVADGVTIEKGGGIFIGSGGVAKNVTIEKGGSMNIDSGGVATGVVWTPCEGGLRIGNGGTVTFTSEYSGVYYGGGGARQLESHAETTMEAKTIGSGYEMHVMNGGVANDAALSYAASMDVYDGGVANSPVLNDYCEVYVHSGGVVNDAAVNSGYLRIYSGGVASKAVLDGNGHVEVLSGGTAKDTVVSGAGGYSSGTLLVSSGGTAQGVSVKPYGSVEVESGGTATGIDWTPCVGRVAVYEGGSATFVSEYSGVYYGAEEQLLSSAGTMEGKELGYHYRMYVMNGGAANNATVNSDGSMYISSGGVANNTTVNSDGYIRIYSGGTASMGVVSSGGVVDVGSGGVARDMTICGRSGWWSSGTIRVNSGGTAVDTTVSSGGQLTVYAGVASNVTVKYNGSIYLNGKVTGRMNFEYGAVVSANEAYGFPVLDFDLTQTTAGADALVTTLSVITGTPKYTLTVAGTEADGTYKLAADAYGFDKTISVVDTSGTELGTLTVADGTKEIGGVKYALTLNKENVLSVMVGEIDPNVFTGELTSATKEITAGSSALCVDVNISGLLKVLDGGTADYTTVNSGGSLHVSEGGVANYTTLNRNFNDDGFTVFKGGVASNTTVDDYGMMIVSSGGSAIDTTLLLSGRCIVYGVASNTVNSGGKLRISSGGVASKTTVVSSNGLYVYDDGTANETTVSSGAGLYVHGGVASNTTVHSYGELYIHSGGTAVGATANASGGIGVEGVASNIIVNSDGVAEVLGTVCNVTISSGGRLYFGAGGKLTGKMTFENDAVVSAFENSFVDFDLTRTSIGAEALLNNLSAIAGELPLYTLTVGGSEAYGEYKLAEGAADFNETITVVNTSGTKLGTLTVGKKAMAGGAAYTLNLTDGSLSVTVEEPENGPEEPLNNYLYDKKLDPVINTNVTEEYGTVLTAAGQEVCLDLIGSIDHDGYHNRVEKAVKGETRDTIDYAKIVLEHGAKLSFHAEATAAATLTVYSLKEKNGKYTLKKLQMLKLTDKDKDGVFTADSKKPLSLQVSGAYYVSMQFKDKKAEEAYYNVSLNGEDAGVVFYNLGYNGDDWDDMKTAGYGGAVGDLGVIDGASLAADSHIVKDEWIGFGDKADYKKFTLESAAELSFALNSSLEKGPLTLTVCRLKTNVKKSGTTYSEVKVKSVTLKAGRESASLNNIRLAAGDYYLKVETSSVKKSTGYGVQVAHSDFYTDGDNGWNNVLLDGKAMNANEVYFYNNELLGSEGAIHLDKGGDYKTSGVAAEYIYKGETYGGFVCFGDETDFAKLTLSGTTKLTFSLSATNDATLEIFKVTQSGAKYSRKSLQTVKYKAGSDVPATTKKPLTLEVKDGVSYYVSVKATNVKNTKSDPRTYYNVSYEVLSTESAASLAMPETSDALAMTDSLSFGQYANADALANASASSLADFDDKSSVLNALLA